MDFFFKFPSVASHTCLFLFFFFFLTSPALESMTNLIHNSSIQKAARTFPSPSSSKEVEFLFLMMTAGGSVLYEHSIVYEKMARFHLFCALIISNVCSNVISFSQSWSVQKREQASVTNVNDGWN